MRDVLGLRVMTSLVAPERNLILEHSCQESESDVSHGFTRSRRSTAKSHRYEDTASLHG